MSKTNTFENDWLKHVFNNVAITLIGDAAGLLPSAAAGNFYVSLHTADPGEASDQTTSEIAYAGYARAAVPRSPAGFTVLNNQVTPTSAISLPAGTAGASPTATHFGVGTSPTGAGKLLYKGPITPTIVCGDGVLPQLTTGTIITEE